MPTESHKAISGICVLRICVFLNDAFCCVYTVNKSPPTSSSSTQQQSTRSDRMQSKLSAIQINLNGDYSADNNSAESKVFRVQSPSDYHTSFKWNDATKDLDSQLIEKLNQNKDQKQFPDPTSYEQTEQQFFEQIDNEDVALMDDKELEKEISTLIENVPIDANEGDDDLTLSSEDDDDEEEFIVHRSSSTSLNANNVDTIHEEAAINTNNKMKLTYSPKGGEDNKSSTIESYTSSNMSDAKKEDLLQTNDEYMAKKRAHSIINDHNEDSHPNEHSKNSTSECQTFLHFTESTSSNNNNKNNEEFGKNSLSIYLQSDNYFDDENQQRDRRKKEQDKESRKRMQREQDVMRGNDNVSIQKSLNSSGMNGDNKPLDGLGNKIVLPSTGIILDETVDKSVSDFFAEQNGLCFSCGDHLGSPQLSRQCYYTQRLFCALCMDGSKTNIIPSKLIHCLDTRKYPISANSKKHLDSMYDVPAVPLSKIELPSWYIPSQSANVSMLKNTKKKYQINGAHDDDDEEEEDDDALNLDDEDSIAVQQQQQQQQQPNVIPNQNEKYYKLIKLNEYLEILSYIKEYFLNSNKECFDISGIVQNALGRRPYLLDAYTTDKDSFGYFLQIIDQHKDEETHQQKMQKKKRKNQIKSIKKKAATYRLYGLISMRDMYELFNKDLLSTMHFAQQHITNHIKACKRCKKRAYGANVQFISKFSELLQ